MTVNINFIDNIIPIIIFILSPYSTQHLQEEKPNVSTWLLILSKKKPLGLEGTKAQQQGWTLYETLPHIIESKRQWPYNDCYLCDHDMINTTMIYEPLPHIVGPCANNLNDVFFSIWWYGLCSLYFSRSCLLEGGCFDKNGEGNKRFTHKLI